jgi:4-amino-4-deoxy-L-arabinose transferase-like glycosyltransferase
MAYPVHLISWGSGQNALYSYLTIPFIALLGNTTMAMRLPMAIVGSVSLYLIYFILDRLYGHRFSLLSLILIGIMPWHIMKSRWGLESNLFPDLILWGSLLILYSCHTKHWIPFYLSGIIMGISSYSYGTSYFFLFFYILILLGYLLIQKKIKWYSAIGYLAVVGVLCIPIILFLYINLFDKETIHLLWFDIPKLKVDRFHSVTSIFSADFLMNIKENLLEGLRLILLQDDSLPWNGISVFGCLYLFTLPFSVIGLFHRNSRKEKLLAGLDENHKDFSDFVNLFRIWLLVSIMLMLILSNNINRLNVIWFSLGQSQEFKTWESI